MDKPFSPTTFPPRSSRRSAGADIYDDGLRRHMLGVYRNMALGLGITALAASLLASTPALYQPIFGTPLKWVAIFAPLAFVLFFSFRVERMTTAQARTAFYTFAAVMGVSMASIFLVFTGTSIALAFASAAAVVAAMSLGGDTDNVDL
jgi:FtsH-binding integral membrane protein